MRERGIEPSASEETMGRYAAYHGTASLAIGWVPCVDRRLGTEKDTLKLRRLDESGRVPRASRMKQKGGAGRCFCALRARAVERLVVGGPAGDRQTKRLEEIRGAELSSLVDVTRGA